MVIIAPFNVLIREQPKLRTRQPDVIDIGHGRLAGFDPDSANILRAVPELVVEIISPSETAAGWAEKLADYAAIGIAELWRVEPDARTVEVLKPSSRALGFGACPALILAHSSSIASGVNRS